VRWVDETGSTNADLLALATDGEPEGIVLVADHQTAGRGRRDRSWQAPPGSSLLVSVLLRPTAAVADVVAMAAALAMAEAVEATCGVAARLKWPNDLVVDVDGADRKLAGVLAEADWPARSPIAAGWSPPPPEERMVVVVGIGLNVQWPADLPADLAATLTALNLVTGGTVERTELLVAYLRALAARYLPLVRTRERGEVLAAWKARSATLGRRVRVDLGADDVVGTAVDVTTDGHLVIDTVDGTRRTVAVGDVVHLRPAN
jgi:BirA family biotin operon repressor/biotin-[acetyl-CoA-carboxylase] ligase